MTKQTNEGVPMYDEKNNAPPLEGAKGDKVMFRQGDVIIIPTKETFDNLTPVPKDKDGSTTLAYGEVTGHRHRFTKDSQAELFTIPSTGKVENAQNIAQQAEEMSLALDKLLVLNKQATLTHEEHEDITLPAGEFIVRIQREYTPEAIVNVMD